MNNLGPIVSLWHPFSQPFTVSNCNCATREIQSSFIDRLQDDLTELSKRLKLDIERLSRVNDQLRSEIIENERRCKQLEEENEELKIHLDGAEKEKARLTDQVVYEWNARVKVCVVLL